MAKHKIPKNRSDAEMMKTAAPAAATISLSSAGPLREGPVMQSEFQRGFVTEKMAERIGKFLLEIKLEYYKEEVHDFSVEIKRDGRNIVLVTAPKQTK
ncbi:MAG: hypothetical protein MR209_07030 [Veillonellaceae bacterium]|nr:hypothetical protein [Veillonellaceae bacterium]